VTVELATRRFTVAEYYRMGKAGILRPDDRVELIRGVIVEMAPIGSRHAYCVDRLTRIFQRALRDEEGWVRTQHPVSLPGDSEPHPDLVIARGPGNQYAQRHPQPDEVLLLIEVADSSLVYDRRTKVPLYAGAGIPEYC
jgi:Uma2 family endonuclease